MTGVQTCALDRKSTRLNSSHTIISYAVFCLKKKQHTRRPRPAAPIDTQVRPGAHPAPGAGEWARPWVGCAGAGWSPWSCHVSFFFFNDTATTEIYTLSLHDALPI